MNPFPLIIVRGNEQRRPATPAHVPAAVTPGDAALVDLLAQRLAAAQFKLKAPIIPPIPAAPAVLEPASVGPCGSVAHRAGPSANELRRALASGKLTPAAREAIAADLRTLDAVRR